MSVLDTPGVIRYVMANDPDDKPRPTTARQGCPRCHTLWEVSGFAWQFECKCRRWSIDATGAESWKAIPGAPPYCCGREMERAITARQYECACGRTVNDDGAIVFRDEFWKLYEATAPTPTDAEIVAMMELCAREEHAAFTTAPTIQVGGVPVSRAECQAAWSRVLAAKVAASDAARTEAARRVVLGPIDDESEA